MKRRLVFALCALAQHIDHVAYAQAPFSRRSRERMAGRMANSLAVGREIIKGLDLRDD